MKSAPSKHPAPEALAALTNGRLPRGQRAAVEQHLSGCSVCARMLKQLQDDPWVKNLRGRPMPATEPPRCSTPIPAEARQATTLPTPLSNHPRYAVQRKLGEGGMGAVWLAEHREMKCPVALKVIHEGVARLPAFVDRFRREVQLAARLDHPNVVRALDAEAVGGAHFLVMEYVEGIHLADHAQRQGGKMAPESACKAIYQAAQGLQHAHERGLVHRDIKPHNLLLDRKGRVKVADFGLARCVRELEPAAAALTAESSTLGTPDYMAPEQADDPRAADIRSDIYSLGCSLYFLLTGQPPHPEGSLLQKIAAHHFRQPTPVTELTPAVPAGLAEVVARAMAKKPTARYQTPAEFAQALKPFFKKPESEPAPPRRRWPTVAAALLLLLVLGGVYYIRTSKGELVIETTGDSVEVVIRKNGEQVEIVDTKSKQKLELKAGTYTAEVAGNAGLTIVPTTFTIRRGQEEIVRVTRRPAVVEKPQPRVEKPEPPRPSYPVTPVAGVLAVSQDATIWQRHPCIAADGAGRFVVAWQATGQKGEGLGIYARRFAVDGSPLGAAIRVNETTSGNQIEPRLSVDRAGNFVVLWTGDGAKGQGVYARRFGSDGKPRGGEKKVNTLAGEREFTANWVKLDDDGTYLAMWHGHVIPGGTGADVYSRRIGPDDEPRGAEVRVNKITPGNQAGGLIAPLSDGEYVVAWNHNAGDEHDIRVQRFKADGTRIGDEIQVNTRRFGLYLSGLAADVQGNFVVIGGGTGNGDAFVYLRRYDAAGKPLTETEEDAPPSASNKQGASLLRRGDGKYLIVCGWSWINEQHRGEGPYAQWFDPAGKPLGEAVAVCGDNAVARYRGFTASALLNDREFVVVWTAEGPSGKPAVFARILRTPEKP